MSQPQHTLAEYYFGLYDYSTTDRYARAEAEIRQRSLDGWRIHTCVMEAGLYLQVMWHRPMPAPAAPAEPEGGQ